MQTVIKEQLQLWINQKEEILLICVLPKKNFKKRNILGSINITYRDNNHFISEVEKRSRSKEIRVVVYSTNTCCELCRKAAKVLDDAGYSNVYAFEEGIESWDTQQLNAA